MKISVSLALAILISGTASAATPCKLPEGGFIYAIGSSTLGSPLGEILVKSLTKRGFKFRKWAKASSGLARPDYFDWPKQVPDVIREWKPDAFIVNLGTNDFQAIFKSPGKWIKPEAEEAWAEEYGRRVDTILELTAGKDKQRMVVWVGPSPFPEEKATRMSQIINDVIKQRIKVFGGPVFYVDSTEPLIANGQVIRTFKAADGKMKPVFRKDHIHMTVEAVRDLMAEPTGDLLNRCTKG